MNNPDYWIGYHVGFTRAHPEQVGAEMLSVHANALSIFMKSPRQFTGALLTDKVRDRLLEGIRPQLAAREAFMPHAGYAINLCTSDATKRTKGKESLQVELDLCHQLSA